ncbi:hypothetical protein SCLCIDRAFT_1221885 [Scleroderma citrinum Foug A]|uniref:VIT domain-containing protein n=1 Tax=Scleroderma citrinum Foug A TaxID=1036808 RepID=A0A0C2YY14_9AGAM|nr:hypothetical protein SCLCIDRAFT_1221885 [Scleroderma citrinum Foug A]
MPPTRTGIVHQPPGRSALEYLPLEKVVVRAWIVDVSARIVLTQSFRNTSDQPTARAKYVFPLPERSAVCAFELERADGCVVIGTVKEKEAAAQTFEAAVAAGKTAGLVESVTDDIFAISVGSIPAAQQVKTCITFTMDLLTEGLRDHVRLQLPFTIFERYGSPPEAMADAATTSDTTCIDIRVDIQTSDVIHTVRSPTHPGISLLRYKMRDGRKSHRRMSASLQSSTFLRGDFVIIVHADGLDKPRCFAEIADKGTIGMQLTLVPSFKVPRISSQEYIFLIDKSGSMGGSRIETAKRTLSMLLRLMPMDQTMFNILSFGSSTWPLWGLSRELDQNSLQDGISHVNGLTADGGGTEIAGALEATINVRKRDRPTAIFLLTDGEVHDLNGPPTIVGNAVHDSPPHAPLRVFVLGIGDASSEMCERIARAGNGECLFAHSHESILGKCARLLNAGRTRKIERIEIDWGVQSVSNESQPSNAASPRLTFSADTLELEPPPALQQAPHALTKIFAGIRFTVFAIISSTRTPSSIKLFTKFERVDDPVEWVVPVTEVKPFKDSGSDIPLVHTLAARKLITELYEGRAPLPHVVGSVAASDDQIRKAAIVRLGLEYQLASRYTSFVAVEDGQQRSASGGRRRSGKGWIRTRLQLHSNASARQTGRREDTGREEEDSLLGTFIDGITSALSFVFNALGGTSSSSTSSQHQNIPGMYVGSDSSLDADDASPRGRSPSARDPGRGSSRRNSAETLSTLSSLEGSCSSCWTSTRSPSPRARSPDPITRAPSPEFVHQGGARRTTPPGQAPSLPVDASTGPPTVSKDAYELFQLLDLDGSFSPSPELKRIVGAGVLEKAEEFGADNKLWATVVAVAYLKENLQDEPDLLDALLAKAGDFIKQAQVQGRGSLPARFEDMVRQASEFLSMAREGTL